MKDFYAILGVNTDSNSDELRIAYEKLSDKFNPELNAQDQFFANRYNEILEAYGVLGDPSKRRQYDAAFINTRQASASERRKIKRYYSTTKGVNSVLTMVLIVLAFVFSYFVYKAINSHKISQVNKQSLAAVNEAPVHSLKRHNRKKRIAKWKAIAITAPVRRLGPVVISKKDPVQPPAVQTASNITESVAATPVKQAAVVVPKPVQQQPQYDVAVANRPAVAPVPSHQPEYLYTTYIKGNETGVVKLRETASYNAETMATIPNNSQVAVLERGGLYYKIRFENYTGYVPKWTVQEK